MGEAKRRAAEIAKLKTGREEWMSSLTDQERTAVLVSERVHQIFVIENGLYGACYLLAMFIKMFLKKRHSIESNAVVGWVNDGTTDISASHAWTELGGKKIDISLSLTSGHPEQLTGDLIILDRRMARGQAQYSYHRDRPLKSMVAMMQLRESAAPRLLEILENKEAEHNQMEAIVRNDDLIEAYFNRAPPSRRFEALVSMIE